MKRKLSLFVTMFSLVGLLIACNGEETTKNGEDTTKETPENQTETNENQTETAGESELVEQDTIVATVNGEEITGKHYNMMFNQTKMLLKQYGQDTTNGDMVKKQTLNALIEKELITQDAQSKGIEVSSDAIDENIEQIKARYEGEQQFQKALDDLQLSEEMFRSQIAYELVRSEYMKQEVPEVTVTDEQVQEFYDQVASQGSDVPAFEEVEEQLRNQLINQEKQKKFSEIVNQLKEESTVETLI